MACAPHPLLTISSIAKILNIHPQTLRLYERAGFVKPSRTKGNTRRYSPQDVEQIRCILRLTREQGVNLAGVEIILNTQHKLERLQQEIEELRHVLANRTQQHREFRTRQRALIKASSRMLIKAQ
jgi:MerR family transcriptional regulator/heat shock protein HspR